MSWRSSDSQIRWVCLQLLSGREISHACEIAEARGWRLSAIVYNLRHKHGWPIITRYDSKRIGHYRLSGGVDTEELEKPKSFYPKQKGGATPSCKQLDIKYPDSEDSSK
ncbi:MAG: hypothetical protein GW748_01720 [Alphaproteobacteria bacterium]|nr:hypothetical protein [Alphaproteobacteria bacterium]NCQ66449.1 hypothetical protein [Alphaproteobacteria bacterium]